MTDLQQQRLKALERQIARLQRRVHQLKQTSQQYSSARTLVFFGGLVLIFFAFNLSNLAGNLAIGLWLALFSGLVYFHRRIKTAIDRFSAWRILKIETRARILLEWDALPESMFAADPQHPFVADLDLFGDYSIHRLLDITVSTGGSAHLRDWLLTTRPDRQLIAQRQTLVRELIPLTTFRERLMLAARPAGNSQRWQGERLLHWLQTENTAPIQRNTVLLLAALTAINIVLVILHSQGLIPPLWIGSVILYLILTGTQANKVFDLFGQSLQLQTELEKLNAVFQFLENYRYQPGSKLAALTQPLVQMGTRPSARLQTIQRIVTVTSIQRNPILWFALNITVPWDIFFAYRLHHVRQTLAQLLPDWLNVLYEVEALNSLAHFAWLNPAYTFPQMLESPELHGRQLGHPLIPGTERISNDFSLAKPGEVALLTGSNMSGKSSFLRTVGVNLCLANIGSVVCADQLQIGLFRLFTCIKVSDSVIDGVSYFYAEVKRLKALLDALQQPDNLPLFFLIDEIFRGTNNRERQIGSQAYLQALTQYHGCGLLTTHDLELIHLAETNPRITNYHFRETIQDGRMVFDYRLRPGGSPTTNALKIMALAGLPLPPEV